MVMPRPYSRLVWLRECGAVSKEVIPESLLTSVQQRDTNNNELIPRHVQYSEYRSNHEEGMLIQGTAEGAHTRWGSHRLFVDHEISRKICS